MSAFPSSRRGNSWLSYKRLFQALPGRFDRGEVIFEPDVMDRLVELETRQPAGDASWSRRADRRALPGATKIRRAAGAPGADGAPHRAAHGQDRASPRAGHPEPRPPSPRPPGGAWPGWRHPAGRSRPGRQPASGSAREQPRRIPVPGPTIEVECHNRTVPPRSKTAGPCRRRRTAQQPVQRRRRVRDPAVFAPRPAGRPPPPQRRCFPCEHRGQPS